MDLLLILTDLLLISTSFNTQPKRAHLGARSLFYYCSYLKHPYLIYRLHTVLSRIRFQASIPLAVSVEVAVSFQAITAFNNQYAISCFAVGEAIAAFQSATPTAAVRIL